MTFLQTCKKLFWISRPISWPNTAYPFAVGYLLAAGASGVDIATLIIGTLYFLGPYNLLMYGINDVYDYESDIKNPRKGGVEGMREERAFHPTILRASVLTNTPFLLYLLIVSSWEARAVLVFVVAMVVAYSLKDLRFKEKPVVDSITSSLHFVGPLLFALALTDALVAAIPFVVAFFLWGVASHAFGAVQDIKPDRKAGIHSIATTFGARTTVRLTWVLYLAASVLVISQGWQYSAVALAGLAYVALVTPYLHSTDATSGRANRGWKQFLWLNYVSGAVVTITIVALHLL
jgi:4-hydroxybenzoate polyprenyltransferase